VVYSVGTGEDISFDLEVIRKYGCDVFAFDPTPMARAFVEEILPPQQFRFLEIGLAGTDGDAKFFPPTQMGFHSFSIKAEGGSRSGVPITRPVRRLSTIMSDLGHQRVDLLKMDIEGFEYSVLEDILDTKVEPDCLLIEFHHKYLNMRSETKSTVTALRKADYKLFWMSDLGSEYGFIKGDLVRNGRAVPRRNIRL
jgi:FkbM family methyltransferase